MKIISITGLFCLSAATTVLWLGCSSNSATDLDNIGDQRKGGSARGKKAALDAWGKSLEQSERSVASTFADTKLSSLESEFQHALDIWENSMREAADPETRRELAKSNPTVEYCQKFAELAETYSGTEAATDALIFVAENGIGRPQIDAMNQLLDLAKKELQPDGNVDQARRLFTTLTGIDGQHEPKSQAMELEKELDGNSKKR